MKGEFPKIRGTFLGASGHIQGLYRGAQGLG